MLFNFGRQLCVELPTSHVNALRLKQVQAGWICIPVASETPCGNDVAIELVATLTSDAGVLCAAPRARAEDALCNPLGCRLASPGHTAHCSSPLLVAEGIVKWILSVR